MPTISVDRYRSGIGGNSDIAMRRAVKLGAAWHPLRFTMPWFREAVDRLQGFAAELRLPVPDLAPRILLRLTDEPLDHPERRAGEGTIDQVLADIEELRLAGAGSSAARSVQRRSGRDPSARGGMAGTCHRRRTPRIAPTTEGWNE